MKPHVICLMAASVDGRTLPSRWRPKGAGNVFEQVHDELAGDAWLVGRVTGQEFAKGSRRTPLRRRTFRVRIGSRGAMQKPTESYSMPMARSPGVADIGDDPIVVVISEQVSDAHLAGLRGEGVSYVSPENPSWTSPSRWIFSIASSA